MSRSVVWDSGEVRWSDGAARAAPVPFAFMPSSLLHLKCSNGGGFRLEPQQPLQTILMVESRILVPQSGIEPGLQQ